ncbi:Dps family protein [Massilia phyllosphaerae]|uniref:Dps family protein n=1 Tax=Massilia phyllosphaerae TaxID=3106034 RepID=UPI002B1CB9FF|nr:DNA starvation/stationary phase protection protein [Massilia sp. SGZ-792]
MADKKKAKENKHIVQEFGALAPVRIGLSEEVRSKSVRALNRLLAHTMAMRDAYKKAHWQTAGATFYELHLLFDKHYEEQAELMDSIAERIQTLGGVTVALPGDVASESEIARAPRGRESARAQLDRLASGHETILLDARPLGRAADDDGDDGTNDLIVSEIVRTNELQSWFIVQHLSRQSELGDVQSPAAEA